MIKRLFLFCALLCVLSVTAFSQTKPTVFIAPMERGLNEFLTAAFIKKKVPVQLVISEEGAEYILKGVSIKGESKWYDTVFGDEKDRNQGSITLLRVSDKSIAWAGSAGDKRGFWDPVWARTGQRKVAERLAGKIKKEYFNGKPK